MIDPLNLFLNRINRSQKQVLAPLHEARVMRTTHLPNIGDNSWLNIYMPTRL